MTTLKARPGLRRATLSHIRHVLTWLQHHSFWGMMWDAHLAGSQQVKCYCQWHLTCTVQVLTLGQLLSPPLAGFQSKWLLTLPSECQNYLINYQGTNACCLYQSAISRWLLTVQESLHSILVPSHRPTGLRHAFDIPPSMNWGVALIKWWIPHGHVYLPCHPLGLHHTAHLTTQRATIAKFKTNWPELS